MRAFIFDTETNGLMDTRLLRDKMQPEIMEFYGALVDLDAGPEPIRELDFMCNIRGQVPEEVTKITGIKKDMLVGLPKFEHYAPDVKANIERAEWVIAHNLSFDMEAVDLEFSRLPGIAPVQWPKPLCTVEQTVHLMGFNLGLGKLHEHLFGEGFADAHRARNDVQALIRCAVELRRRKML